MLAVCKHGGVCFLIRKRLEEEEAARVEKQRLQAKLLAAQERMADTKVQQCVGGCNRAVCDFSLGARSVFGALCVAPPLCHGFSAMLVHSLQRMRRAHVSMKKQLSLQTVHASRKKRRSEKQR